MPLDRVNEVNMIIVNRVYHDTSPPPMAHETPIGYVGDDISARESLAASLHYAGHQAELFASPRGFLTGPAALITRCLVLDASP